MAGSFGAQIGDPREVRLASLDASVATLTNTKADLASPTFSGTPSLPTGTTATTQTAGDSSTKLATTAFVATSFAPLASPSFSGTPSLPTGTTATTQTAGDSSTKLATTAFVTGGIATSVIPLANKYITGGAFYYYCARGITAPATAGFIWPGDQYTIVSPWYVPNAITLTNAGLEMKTGATGGGSPTLHMMIYSDNGSGYPGALFCDIGAVDSSGTASIEYITGAVTKFTTPNQTQLIVPAGLYWIGARSNGVVTDQPYVYGIAGSASNIPCGTTKPTTGAAFNMGFLHTGGGTDVPTDPFPAYGVSGAAVSVNAPRMFVKLV